MKKIIELMSLVGFLLVIVSCESALAPEAGNETLEPTAYAVYRHAGVRRFNGVNDYIKIMDESDLDLTTNFTLAAWVKKNDTGRGYIFSKDGLGTDTEGAYNLDVTTKVGYETNNLGSLRYGSLSRGIWQHVAVTFNDSADPNMRLYIDGEEVETGNVPSPTPNERDLLIGRRGAESSPDSPDSPYYFDGEMADMRIYSETLSEPRVEALAANAPDGTYNSYYVASDGSDSNNGASANNPVKTIQKAVDMARAGDTVFVRGGTYVQQVHLRQDGRSGAPITLAGYPGETVIIDGNGDAGNDERENNEKNVVRITADWIVLENLTLQNGGWRGVAVSGAQHVALRDIIARDNGESGVHFWLSSDSTAKNITSYNNYDEPTFGEHADGFAALLSERITLDGCRLYNNSDDGFDAFHSIDITVRNCAAYENGYGRDGNGNGFKLSNVIEGMTIGAGSSQRTAGADGRTTVVNTRSWGNRTTGYTGNGGAGHTLTNIRSCGNPRTLSFWGPESSASIAGLRAFEEAKGPIVNVSVTDAQFDIQRPENLCPSDMR